MGITAYQPGNDDLLINTRWGTPKDELGSDEARQRGLVLWHSRWVTTRERARLKREKRTYDWIRGISLWLIVSGVFLLLNEVLGVAYAFYRSGGTLDIPLAYWIEAAINPMIGVLSIYSGFNARRYRNFARHIILGMVIAVLVSELTPLLSGSTERVHFLLIQLVKLVVVILVFYSSVAGAIFTRANQKEPVAAAR